MKYLQDYVQEEQTKLFNETGTFFAFSEKQFNEQKRENTKYTNCNMGMLCPTENVKALLTGLDEIYKKGIQQDIAENGIEAIVVRELTNHEAYYTGDIQSTVDSLIDYPVTVEEILKIYRAEQLKEEVYEDSKLVETV